ncbi:hypothetical protein EMPS_06296 [Entomortierella parvispora]|uniref:Rab-GAP TBC domain-containing protein n=1 Tax=Entomortierella parvispora TaxID=205924 RepID=A0A9P3HCM9_9FUNG|nr:hypothetical protein EMPS_06296 [Entomortierella parvispora]
MQSVNSSPEAISSDDSTALTPLTPTPDSAQHKSLYSTGLLSLPNQSSVQFVADISNTSSATITTNLLGITSHVFQSHIFNQHDHQQPRISIPSQSYPHQPTNGYQLSTPSASSNSLAASRPDSPAPYTALPRVLSEPSQSVLIGLRTEQLEATAPLHNTPATEAPMEEQSATAETPVDIQSVHYCESALGSLGSRQKRPTCSSFSSSTSSSVTFASLTEHQELTFSQKKKEGPRDDTAGRISPTLSDSHHSHQDRTLTTVFDDLKAKTHQALRKTGLFSIAPDAGLYADRETSKPADMKVIRMFPASPAASATMAVSSIEGNSGREGSDSTHKERKETKEGAKGLFGRPRSRSVKETCRAFLSLDSTIPKPTPAPLPPVPRIPRLQVSTATIAAPSTPADGRLAITTPPPPPSPSSSFAGRLDKLRPWSRVSAAGWGGGHQRSNSGPAHPSDQRILSGISHQLSLAHVPQAPTLPSPQSLTEKDSTPLSKEDDVADEGRQEDAKLKSKPTHRRRTSEAMSIFSFRSGFGGAPSAPVSAPTSVKERDGLISPMPASPQQSVTQDKNHRSKLAGHWFGAKRHNHQQQRSVHSVDGEELSTEMDTLKKLEHVPQWKMPGAYNNRPRSVVFVEGDHDIAGYKRIEAQGQLESEEDDGGEDYVSDSEDGGAEAALGDTEAGNDCAHTKEDGPRAENVLPDMGEVQDVSKKSKKRAGGKQSIVYVNDYGFIYDTCSRPDMGRHGVDKGGSEKNQRRHQVVTTTNSDLITDSISSIAEQERERVLKKRRECVQMNEQKWIYAMTHMQPDQIKKSTKYKKLVRTGIPNSIRGRVWQFLANTEKYREPGLFQKLLLRGHLPIHDVIARDIHRCYPDHVHFRDGMGGTGQEDLHAILKAYAHYKPSVGYCQGMGRLVGMMLMQMPVEEAFWLLVATIESPYLQDYYTPTLRQLRVDAIVFERLLKVQDPKLATFLERNDVGPLMYMTQWYLTLFTMSLPWASVLRVWDVFYFDGIKTLFRVGLGVLQICRPHLLSPHRGGNDPSHGDNGTRAFFSGSDHNHERGYGDNRMGSSSGIGRPHKESREAVAIEPTGPADVMEFLLHVPLDILGPERLLEKAFRIRLRRDSLEKMTTLAAAEMDRKEAIEQERRRIKLQQQHQRQSETQEQAQSQLLSNPEADQDCEAEDPSKATCHTQVAEDGEGYNRLTKQDDQQDDPSPPALLPRRSSNTALSDTAEWRQTIDSTPVMIDRPRSQPSKKSSMRSFMTSSLPLSSSSSSKSSLSLTLQQVSPLSSNPLTESPLSISASALPSPQRTGPPPSLPSTRMDTPDPSAEGLSPPSSPVTTVSPDRNQGAYSASPKSSSLSSSPPPSLGIFSFRTRKRAGTLHH